MKKNKNLIIGLIIIIIIILGIILLTTSKKEGKLQEISYKEIKEKVNNNEDMILIVSRSTCSHCMEYKPKVEQIARKNNIIVYYIDYDNETKENEEKFLEEFNLDGSTPITLFIKEGKETSIFKRLEGDVEKDIIMERFEEMGFISN